MKNEFRVIGPSFDLEKLQKNVNDLILCGWEVKEFRPIRRSSGDFVYFVWLKYES